MKKLNYFSFFNLTCALFVCLFFFIPKIYAWTYDATITDTEFAYLDNLSSQRSIVETAISNNSASYSSSYMTYYSTWDNQYYTFIIQPGNTLGTSNFVNWTSSYGVYFNAINRFAYNCRINFNNNSLESCYQTAATTTNNLYSQKYITYINFNYPIRNDENTNTLVFHYNNDTYQLINGDYIVSLDDLKAIFLTPPTPPDNTPLLTQFYSLCIDKMALVVEEFSSNYIYLSIIAIIIFTSILLIIKRRLFK